MKADLKSSAASSNLTRVRVFVRFRPPLSCPRDDAESKTDESAATEQPTTSSQQKGVSSKRTAKPSREDKSPRRGASPKRDGAPSSFATRSGKRGIKCWDESANTITVSGAKTKVCRFLHGVLPPTAGQADTYGLTLSELVDRFVAGYDVNLMAYGQTGSGKTHTMFGPPAFMTGVGAAAAKGELSAEQQEQCGIFFRAAMAVLQLMTKKQPTGWVLEGRAVQCRMGAITDLLNEKSVCALHAATHGVIGATHVRLKEPRDVLGLLAVVADKRETGGTLMNQTSSRSHCFTTLILTQKGDGQLVTTSRFNMVDLAGSERLKNAHACAKTQSATAAIKPGGWNNVTMDMLQGLSTNYGLTILQQCAMKVRDRLKRGQSAKNVNFRDHPLTRLLSETLVGTAMSACVICVSLDEKDGSQAAFSLDFGKIIAGVRTPAKPKPAQQKSKLVAQQQISIKENQEALKKLLENGVKRGKKAVWTGVSMGRGKYMDLRQAAITYSDMRLKVLEDLGES